MKAEVTAMKKSDNNTINVYILWLIFLIIGAFLGNSAHKKCLTNSLSGP